MSYNTEITDFGEKIGGARKDLWRSRGLKIEDLTDLNLKEYVEHVTKDNIWPAPDYRAYAGKMSNACIYYMKFVRDKIKAKLEVYDDGKDRERAELYIIFLNTAKEACLKMTTNESIRDVQKEIQSPYIDERGYGNDKYRNTPGMDRAFLDSIMFSSSEMKRFLLEADIQGFPETFRGDMRGITIRQEFYSSKGFRISNSTRYLTAKSFSTEEEAIAYAKTELAEELDGKKKVRKASSVVNIVRPQLEHIERIGPDIRKGKNASTENILQAFKFRGGEFGNWNTQDDRQACLNYVFDSLVDLACILDYPLDLLSLGDSRDTKKGE